MPSRRARERGGAAAPVRRLVDFWPRMRRERRESPSRGAGRAEGGRAGPGSPESRRRCEPRCGCEGAWVRRAGSWGQDGAGLRPEPAGKATQERSLPAPRGSFTGCHGPVRAPGRAAHSLAHSRSPPATVPPAEPRGTRERASQRAGGGRDQGGGNEGAPRLSLGRAARPSCCHRSAPSPDHTWETWDNVEAACGTLGGGPGL